MKFNNTIICEQRQLYQQILASAHKDLIQAFQHLDDKWHC
jgi:hypothetical protein